MAEETANTSQPSTVACPPTKEPAVRGLIGAVMFLGMGAYCYYEAFILDQYAYKPNGNVNDLMGYVLNRWGPWLLMPLGIAMAGWAIYFLTRTMEADEQGIGWKDQDRIPWASIDELDAGKLKSKGLLYLRHGGKTITLDSWKMQNFKQMVDFVDKHVPASKRVG